MFRPAAGVLAFFLLASPWFAGPGLAQEGKKTFGSVQISFLPPPLEKATYSLGIFDAKSGKLVRHLQEIAVEKDFTVGLNGLLTAWDGKDDHGKAVLPGRYAARGYAVGPLKIVGEDVQGNDWAAGDEKCRFNAVAAILYVPEDGGLVILATQANHRGILARFASEGKLLWRKTVANYEPRARPWLTLSQDTITVMPRLGKAGTDDTVVSADTYRLSDGQQPEERGSGGLTIELSASTPPPLTAADVAVDALPVAAAPGDEAEATKLIRQTPNELRGVGKDRTSWIAAGSMGLAQTDRNYNVLRRLAVAPNDPLPRQVSSSDQEDRLYLLETRPGWQRVRGLAWSEAKEEEGHPVSTWKTFFERSIRTAAAAPSTTPVEVALIENPLVPGKPQKLSLFAGFDEKSSYLATESGLRLRRISERANLETARLVKSKVAGALSFYQSDGAATDEFSITGVRNIMEFDAGEFEMTATGEKPTDSEAVEPPDL